MSTEEINYTQPDLDEIVDYISKGGFGKICLVLHDGEILARKEVVRKNAGNVGLTINEIEILKGLKHKNVV